ncbi:SdpI family protein [Corynebacterium liangguodongii]|uniref:Uncharacterized protein n=1 Tax=Corynebacterium liangguodongii TaxID=2079535 RepID=A0A2S0WGY5_9CORY|nr:SdpI family protein [Corynebacterium liangguodongii]AWB84942.1 hypothetical protein C3E79_11060 [Corynebacterium liangguodongii]PWB99350.1 hypothetical protein DF219_07215 [Corynebacterium liangguodongii]
MNVVFGIVFGALALVLFVIGALATAGRLPGNPVIGLRVAAVRKSEEIWVKAHKVAGPFVLFAAVALTFGAAFAFIAQGWLWVAPIITAVLAVVALSFAGNAGARVASLLDAPSDTPDSTNAQPTPQVDLDALRGAARKADGR